MHRRHLITAVFCCGVPFARAQEGPRHKIHAAQLHAALGARFPLRLGAPGWLQLHVGAPRLLLAPERNKLGATLVATPAGPGLEGAPSGEIDLVFALRYEPTDRTVRAYQPEVLDLRLPSVPGELTQALRRLLPRLAREAITEVVVHEFSARELALPDTMGFEPDRLTVLTDGLLVTFRPKPGR